ncbi:hypothetical protein BC829DRAFT_445471 [Chytridium lagenaria]|nr:hypothetical protein BC829DRAFT_445471 [Chytridium lagenaria]
MSTGPTESRSNPARSSARVILPAKVAALSLHSASSPAAASLQTSVAATAVMAESLNLQGQMLWMEEILPQEIDNAIANMDQTCTKFDDTAKTTVSRVGVKTVSVKKLAATGGKRAMTMLCVTGDGGKLPPGVVFIGTPGARVEKECRDLSQAWVFGNNCNALTPALHLKASSSGLQVLDVGINKLFKNHMEGCSARWMVSQLTSGIHPGSLPTIDQSSFLNWILESCPGPGPGLLAYTGAYLWHQAPISKPPFGSRPVRWSINAAPLVIIASGLETAFSTGNAKKAPLPP